MSSNEPTTPPPEKGKKVSAEEVAKVIKKEILGRPEGAPRVYREAPPARFPVVATVTSIAIVVAAILVVPWVRGLLKKKPLVAGITRTMPPMHDNEWTTIFEGGPGRWSEVTLPRGWTRDVKSLLGAKDSEALELPVPSWGCVVDLEAEFPEGSAGLTIELLEANVGYRIAWRDGGALEWTAVPNGKLLGRASAPAGVGPKRRVQIVWNPEGTSAADVDVGARLTGEILDPLDFQTIKVRLRPTGGAIQVDSLKLLCPVTPQEAPPDVKTSPGSQPPVRPEGVPHHKRVEQPTGGGK